MRIEHMIEKEQEHVKNIDINIKNYQKKCDEIEQYLEENKIQGKQILFLHTGGTPLFFDFLEQEDKSE